MVWLIIKDFFLAYFNQHILNSIHTACCRTTTYLKEVDRYRIETSIERERIEQKLTIGHLQELNWKQECLA